MSRSEADVLDAPLIDELQTLASDRVNALPSVVAERFVSLRYDVDRANRIACDGHATAATPDVDAETPVEVKAVRVSHHDGEGRLSVHTDSHRQLRDAGGVYAIVLYAPVSCGGNDRIVVLTSAIVDADEVGRCVALDGAADYQKVRWSRVLDDADVDVARWSA